MTSKRENTIELQMICRRLRSNIELAVSIVGSPRIIRGGTESAAIDIARLYSLELISAGKHVREQQIEVANLSSEKSTSVRTDLIGDGERERESTNIARSCCLFDQGDINVTNGQV